MTVDTERTTKRYLGTYRGELEVYGDVSTEEWGRCISNVSVWAGDFDLTDLLKGDLVDDIAAEVDDY